VLQQREGGGWRPLAFYSKKLDTAQHKYSAFDRELLAAYLAIGHFRFQLEGRTFTLFTDHKPLTFALRRQGEPWTSRQQGQLSFIAEFTANIRHVAGDSNVVADVLLRPAGGGREAEAGLLQAGTCSSQLGSISTGPAAAVVDYVAMADAQRGCQD
jgi:hypothetical protein